MFSDSVLSCCLLFLASGSTLYVSFRKDIDNLYKPEIVAASVGVLALNLRSLFNFLSPFFFYASYPIDPLEIDDEDIRKAESRLVPRHEKLCRVLSMSGFIYALCEAYENRKTGIFIISSLIIAEIYHAIKEKRQRNRLFHFLWILAGGLFGLIKGSNYCVYSYLPYGISFLVLTPEKDCAWSARRIINNYMMMAHMFIMIEAIREARHVNL